MPHCKFTWEKKTKKKRNENKKTVRMCEHNPIIVEEKKHVPIRLQYDQLSLQQDLIICRVGVHPDV